MASPQKQGASPAKATGQTRPTQAPPGAVPPAGFPPYFPFPIPPNGAAPFPFPPNGPAGAPGAFPPGAFPPPGALPPGYPPFYPPPLGPNGQPLPFPAGFPMPPPRAAPPGGMPPYFAIPPGTLPFPPPGALPTPTQPPAADAAKPPVATTKQGVSGSSKPRQATPGTAAPPSAPSPASPPTAAQPATATPAKAKSAMMSPQPSAPVPSTATAAAMPMHGTQLPFSSPPATAGPHHANPSNPYAWSKADPRFFSEDFEAMTNLWQLMPTDVGVDWLAKTAAIFENSLDQVDQRLSQKVMQSYDGFVVAMNRIQTLNADLNRTNETAKECKTSLSTAKDHLAISGLKIVSGYAKRQQLRTIIEHLLRVYKLQQYRLEVQAATRDGDFPKAVSLCLNCREIVKNYQNISIVACLTPVIRDEFVGLKRRLDSALFDCCRSKFNPALYDRVIKALCLVNSVQSIMEAHQKHFKNTVENSAKKIVLTHVLMNPKLVTNAEALSKMAYGSLCKRLPPDQFSPCLNMILEQFSELMFCNFAMVKWLGTNNIMIPGSDPNTMTGVFDPLIKGLVNVRKVVWEGGILRRLTLLIASGHINSFSVPQFLSTLDSIQKFVTIGEEFIGSPAYKLREYFNDSSFHYFESFHKNRMEELRGILESELWAPVPVHKDYSLRDIAELQATLSDATVGLPRYYMRRPLSFFVLYEVSGNPFAPDNLAKELARRGGPIPTNIMRLAAAEDGPVDKALLVSEVDEVGGRSGGNNEARGASTPTPGAPLISSATISVLRSIAKYIDLMKTLEHLAMDVFEALCSYIEYYIYSVYSFFGLSHLANQTRFDSSLLSLLRRIQSTVILEPPPSTGPAPVPSFPEPKHPSLFKIPRANINVQLTKSSLHQVIPSAVAAEAMMFLSKCLFSLKSTIQGLLPLNKVAKSDEYFDTTVQKLPALRESIFKGVANKIIAGQATIQSVAGVDWGTNDIPANAHSYVPQLLQELGNFLPKLKNLVRQQTISQELSNTIWECLVLHIIECLIEGWSRAKKCSTEGRATMSLDLNTLEAGIHKLTPGVAKKPLATAEGYIKAFYLPDNELMTFVEEHCKDYTQSQLTQLIHVGRWQQKTKILAADIVNRSK